MKEEPCDEDGKACNWIWCCEICNNIYCNKCYRDRDFNKEAIDDEELHNL